MAARWPFGTKESSPIASRYTKILTMHWDVSTFQLGKDKEENAIPAPFCGRENLNMCTAHVPVHILYCTRVLPHASLERDTIPSYDKAGRAKTFIILDYTLYVDKQERIINVASCRSLTISNKTRSKLVRFPSLLAIIICIML